MLSISITLYIALKLNIKLTRIDKSTGKQTIYYFLPGWFSGWRSGEVQGGPHVPSVGHEVPLKPQLIGVPRLIVDSIEQLRGLEVALQIAQSFDKAQKVRDEEGASIAVDHYVSTFRTVVKKAQHVALTNGNEHLTEEILAIPTFLWALTH